MREGTGIPKVYLKTVFDGEDPMKDDFEDEYKDRDNWIGYDYRKMVIDLEHGREIEFTCNNKEFGIFKGPKGPGGWEFAMAKPEHKMLIVNCRNVHDLIKNIRIDGKTLEELFRDNELTEKNIIHIF